MIGCLGQKCPRNDRMRPRRPDRVRRKRRQWSLVDCVRNSFSIIFSLNCSRLPIEERRPWPQNRPSRTFQMDVLSVRRDLWRRCTIFLLSSLFHLRQSNLFKIKERKHNTKTNFHRLFRVVRVDIIIACAALVHNFTAKLYIIA